MAAAEDWYRDGAFHFLNVADRTLRLSFETVMPADWAWVARLIRNDGSNQATPTKVLSRMAIGFRIPRHVIKETCSLERAKKAAILWALSELI